LILRLRREVEDNIRKRFSRRVFARRSRVIVYSRADLLRILHLTPRQLANWERAGLVTSSQAYSFFDLLQVKKVSDLCDKSVSPAVIRESLEAMQK
jgi:hypothetical protein